MSHLSNSHPDISEELQKNGSWTLQRLKAEPFSSVAADQAIEQTANKDCKTRGGLRGITLNKGYFLHIFDVGIFDIWHLILQIDIRSVGLAQTLFAVVSLEYEVIWLKGALTQFQRMKSVCSLHVCKLFIPSVLQYFVLFFVSQGVCCVYL